MADQPMSAEARRVTHVLADLGMYFTVGLFGPKGEWPRWEFDMGEGDRLIHLGMYIIGEWLYVTCADLGDPVPERSFRDLLRLDGNLIISRVALNDEDRFFVWAAVSIDEITAPNLQRAVGATLFGVDQVRQTLSRSTVPPTATFHGEDP